MQATMTSMCLGKYALSNNTFDLLSIKYYIQFNLNVADMWKQPSPTLQKYRPVLSLPKTI